MPDGVKGADAFGVDHYRPASKFPELRSSYENLFYACNACNRRKGNFWPEDWQRAADLFIPNPCDHVMADHLSYRETQVVPRSTAGQLAIEILLLNDNVDMAYRAFVLRQIEQCLWVAKRILITREFLENRISQAQGPVREQLLRDYRLLEHRFARIHEDLERLSFPALIPPLPWSLREQ
jgi:hypothetical protein